MPIYKTKIGQNAFDVSLQLFGGTENVVALAKANNAINVSGSIVGTPTITYTSNQNALSSYVAGKQIDICTSQEATSGDAFDSSFDTSFN